MEIKDLILEMESNQWNKQNNKQGDTIRKLKFEIE